MNKPTAHNLKSISVLLKLDIFANNNSVLHYKVYKVKKVKVCTGVWLESKREIGTCKVTKGL